MCLREEYRGLWEWWGDNLLHEIKADEKGAEDIAFGVNWEEDWQWQNTNVYDKLKKVNAQNICVLKILRQLRFRGTGELRLVKNLIYRRVLEVKKKK